MNKLYKEKVLTVQTDKISKKEEEINRKIIENKKKFMLIFLIFLQILNEMYYDNKERAILLYKFFKIYFCEIEKKWSLVIKKMEEKMVYFKNLCKSIVIKNNIQKDNINSMTEILFNEKLNENNLKEHKDLIQSLAHTIEDRKNEIYLLKSDIEILEKELEFFTHDFQKLKLNKDFRNKLSNINLKQLIKNATTELETKKK